MLVSLSNLKTVLPFLSFLILSICDVGFCSSLPLQHFKVGVYENPPKVSMSSSGRVSGIFPDLLNVIADKENWVLEYRQCSWQECLKQLERGQLDIMVDIASSRERLGKFLFSNESVFLNWGSIYTNKNVSINSFLDLNKRTIATVNEDIHTTGEDGIRSIAAKFDLDIKYVPVESYREALEMVESGKADGGVVNRLFGSMVEDEFDIIKSPLIFNPVQLKFAFPKDEKYIPIANKIDEYIKKLKDDPDSVFHTIVNTYLAGGNFDLDIYRGLRPLSLTDEERKWLAEHKIIRIGIDKAYPPYSFRSKDGIYQGLAVDLSELVQGILNIKFEVIDQLTWPQILQYSADKKIDVVLAAIETPEREKDLKFTQIYLPTPLVITTKDDYDKIEGPEDLVGKKVALVRGYATTDLALKEHSQIIPLLVDTPLDGLAAVSAGKADCYIGALGVNSYTAKIHGIANLKVAARYNMLQTGQRIGVREDWPELVKILDKALNSISERKRLELFRTWEATFDSLEGPALLQQQNSLTAEETNWVKAHEKILLGVDPEFAPFEFIDKEGNYKGITSEYLKILKNRIGITFDIVPGLTWNEAVDRARNGTVDALPCVGENSERKKFLIFSKPYLNFQRVIITRADTPFIASIEDISGMKVAVQQNTSHAGFLQENTTIKPVYFPTLQETLLAVSNKKVDAMVGNLSSAIYWIRRENLTNLKVAGPVAYSSEHLHFAVRKDMPELVGIVEKGLASISALKEKQIRDKWISVEYAPVLNPKKILQYLLQGLGVVAAILIGFFVWNYRLKNEIAKQTANLEQTNNLLIEEIQIRKEAEEKNRIIQAQLFQAQKMESLGTLAGGIAHDFNNILSAIIGYTELAFSTMDKNSSGHSYLREIYAAGLRARDLVQQILTICRRDKTETKPVQIVPEIKDALKMLRATIPTSVEFRESITRESLIVEINPTHLHQVIVNLVTNAWQAMVERGGVLEISVAPVSIDSERGNGSSDIPPGNYCQIAVKDTGQGISKEDQKKIFEPYFTTKEKGTGTGLGLSIVHGIVNSAKGCIEVESEIGSGTTIRLYLPLVSKSAPAFDENDIVSIPKGSERILIVDDEKAIAQMQHLTLERLGYKVTSLTSSLDALETFRKTPKMFDLVITDMNMPLMTGDSLAKNIKTIQAGIPIILNTGFSDRASKALEGKIVDHLLMKPVDTAKMAKIVRKLLDRSA